MAPLDLDRIVLAQSIYRTGVDFDLPTSHTD